MIMKMSTNVQYVACLELILGAMPMCIPITSSFLHKIRQFLLKKLISTKK